MAIFSKKTGLLVSILIIFSVIPFTLIFNLTHGSVDKQVFEKIEHRVANGEKLSPELSADIRIEAVAAADKQLVTLSLIATPFIALGLLVAAYVMRGAEYIHALFVTFPHWYLAVNHPEITFLLVLVPAWIIGVYASKNGFRRVTN